MNYRLDMGIWGSIFAVPSALVDEHLKLASKEQLQVILFALCHPGNLSPDTLSKALGMSENTALDALDYWAERGFLCAANAPPPAQNETAAKATEAPVQAEETKAEPEEKEPLPPKKRLLRPDNSYIKQRMSESHGIKFLMQEAESILGKTLSPAMSSLLLSITDDYGLPPEVIVMLLHYTKNIGRTGTAYIDSVARDWAENGIFSIGAAEEKLRQLSETQLAWSKVMTAAGISKRSPTKKEEDAAYRWVYEWKIIPELLTAAYERCADNTGKFSAAYMDKVLASWHQLGIRNLKELEAAEEKRLEQLDGAKKSSKSYDIEELETLSLFDIPEDL